MSREMVFKLPGREADEPDITEKQLDFIDDLCDSLDVDDVNFDPPNLGRRQASSLIDELIELRDKGAEGIGAINVQFDSSVPSRSAPRMTILLACGIFLMPYIFAWLTLRPGYGRASRIISFAWLAWLVYALFPAFRATNT